MAHRRTLRPYVGACLVALALGCATGPEINTRPCSPDDLKLWRFSAARGIAAARGRYPKEAVAAGLQGRVTIQLSVDAAGKLLEANVAESSGHALLDAEALAMVRRASFAPAPNCGALPRQISQTMPIAFELSN